MEPVRSVGGLTSTVPESPRYAEELADDLAEAAGERAIAEAAAAEAELPGHRFLDGSQKAHRPRGHASSRPS